MHLQWIDINSRERTLWVRSTPKWVFRIKDSEQRDVPITDKLFEPLRSWHEQEPGRELLFATAKGKPHGHLLRELNLRQMPKAKQSTTP